MASQDSNPIAGPFDQPDNFRTLAIKVEDRTFWVSRELLASYSPVFAAMLYGKFIEGGNDTIPLPGKKAVEFEQVLLCLIPTPEIKEIDLSNVEVILRFAEEYQIDELRRRADILLNGLAKELSDTDEKLIEILLIGSKYRMKKALAVIIKKCAIGFGWDQLRPTFESLRPGVVAGLLKYKYERDQKCKFEYRKENCPSHYRSHYVFKCVNNGCDAWACSYRFYDDEGLRCPSKLKDVCGSIQSSAVDEDVRELLNRM